jgi:hypothetical protein
VLESGAAWVVGRCRRSLAENFTASEPTSHQSPLSDLQQASPAKIKALFVTASPTYSALSASTGFTEAALRARTDHGQPGSNPLCPKSQAVSTGRCNTI